MASEMIALQKVSEDKKWRLTVHVDEYAEHPLNMCDFPLHMDDWSRYYSANPTMWHRDESKREHYHDMEACMRQLLVWYGDEEKIMTALVKKASDKQRSRYDCALIWNVGRKEWLLCHWETAWIGYDNERIEAHWCEEYAWCCKREEIDLCYVLDYIEGNQLAELMNTCMTDKCKVMSYDFDYYGKLSFYADVDEDCQGIAWLVKDEAVGEGKYLTEEQWKTQDCYMLSRGEREELVAYSEGNVFWYEVEKNVRWKVHRECLSEERPDEDYEQEEWEEVDCIGGFYGIDSVVEYAIERNNLPPMIEAA